MLAAAVVTLSVSTRAGWPTAAGVLLAVWPGRRRRVVLGLTLGALGLVALARGGAAVDALQPRQLGPFEGWALVAADPQPAGAATRVIIDIEGQRFETWIRGAVRSQRARGLRAGDFVMVAGERAALADGRVLRVRWQHVVGAFEAEWVGDQHVGGPLARSANRVRRLIEQGASSLPHDRAALTRGLVIGDDRDQSPEMIERFRDSGLSHLTAVSGQNVALAVAAAGPLLRTAGPFLRWVATLALIGWFVVVTRAEPSVLRAGVMAGLAATAFALGRPGQPARLLALAVTALVLADPLLVWSVGFWLSVGATGGVVVIGPRLAGRLQWLGPLALPVGVTLGAQAGVAVPSLLVFGRLSLVGTVANLFAVPVAGFVMLAGLPACLVAGAVPAVRGGVMAPIGWAVAWVDLVARSGAAVEPHGGAAVAGWIALGAALAWLLARGRSTGEMSD